MVRAMSADPQPAERHAQFVEAARRQPRPWQQEPVLMRTPELYWTRHEVGHIQDAHYPNGRYVGRPGPRRRSVPTRTMSWRRCWARRCSPELPRRSVRAPGRTALRLGAGRSPPVRDVLRQYHENGPHVALVALAACASDLTVREHDEVLTLATALLAAGASGVIGTKWEIDDLAAAMFMIAFHHLLNTEHPDPAAVLRAAQLWMLDPDRRSIPGALERNSPSTSPKSIRLHRCTGRPSPTTAAKASDVDIIAPGPEHSSRTPRIGRPRECSITMQHAPSPATWPLPTGCRRGGAPASTSSARPRWTRGWRSAATSTSSPWWMGTSATGSRVGCASCTPSATPRPPDAPWCGPIRPSREP